MVEMYDNTSKFPESIIIVSTAENIENNKHIADEFKSTFDYNGKVDGYFKGEWIVFDLEEFIIHMMIPKIKDKYNLDKLYKNNKLEIKQ